MNEKETTTTTATDPAATATAQGAQVTLKKAPSKKGATQKNGAPKAHNSAKSKAKAASPKEAKAKKAKAKKAAKPARTKEPCMLRPESKGAKVLELISRSKGASLAELMKATGWQAHSVRGLISGILGTKMGLQVVSAKREDGERVYSMAK